jgi:hypothetical protein
MFSEKTQKQLVLVGGTISALGGIVGGATNVFVNVGGLANLSLPRWASWLASALLVFLGLWLLIKWRARHSVLLRPDALRLSRDKAEHLVGRVEDVENLHSQCFAKLIIFLEGESGSGKSALVRAGLLPRLKGDKSVEPLLLIDSWVDDWEQGALQTLKTALINCSALKPDLPADPASLTKEAAQNESALTEVSKALIKLNDEQKRKPLIIFDQFDDYQARNRDRFLPNKTWLDPATLRAQNSFWNMVANLLEQDKLRCLFVTRSDTAAGLSSVEFLLKPVQAQRLDRVPAPDMSELLLRLTKEGPDGPVIADPESGWNRLRDRIIRDISNQDVVLPQQLKIMLGGIQSLRRLNVAQYERAGGAAGIEAIYVEQRVFSAARKVSIDANQIRAMLLAMIDPSNPSKTLSRLKAQLLEVAAKAGTQAIPPEKLEVALGELERGEVVRSANDLECGEVTYRLDHDYLTRGVVAAERRANRWHYLLKEGARAFGDAGSIATQWRALLPVTEQCQLVWQRLQGKFRYGSERSYALASLTRFTPTALALLFVLFAWAAYLHLSAASAARDRAQAIWRKFDFSSGIESQEVEGVWMLATTTDPRVRQAFVDQFLDSPEDAKRFLRHPEFLLHALVGLDLDWRDRLSGMVISGGLGGRAIRRERPFPFSFEDDPPVDDLVLSQLRSIGASTVGDAFKGIETAKDSDARRAYAVALEELLPTATATEVRSLVGPIVQSLKLKTNPDMLSVLRTSLSIIARQLSSDDARALAQAVLDAIQRETSFYGLSNDLVETFSAILQRMRTPEAGGFAGVIVGSLKESMRPERRALSAKLFRASAYYLETAKARALADPILQLVIINPKSLVAESGTIETMAPFMNPEIARSVAASLLDALKENPYGQTPISSALGAVAAQLSREDAKALTHRLLEDMKGVKDSERVRVSIFVPPLRAAAANLNPDEAGALAVSIFEPIKGAQEIKGEREKDQITSLGIAFGVVAEKLGPNDARALSDTIWEVLQRSKDGTQLGVVASALRATAIHLGADDGRLLVNKLKDAMRLKTVSGGLVAIAQATQAVAPRLTPEDAIALRSPLWEGLKCQVIRCHRCKQLMRRLWCGQSQQSRLILTRKMRGFWFPGSSPR